MICNDDMTQNTANLYVGLSNGAIAGYAFNSRGVLVKSFNLHDASWKSGASQMVFSSKYDSLLVGLDNGAVMKYGNAVQKDFEMSNNIPILGTKTLKQLCISGTHDIGISQNHNSTSFDKDVLALTQTQGVYDPLMPVVRYFDIKPVMGSNDGQYSTGHSSDNRQEESGITGSLVAGKYTWAEAEYMASEAKKIIEFDELCQDRDLEYDVSCLVGFTVIIPVDES